MMNNGKIVAFCCENSALLAAESAPLPDGLRESVRIVPLPCSGRMETALALRTLEKCAGVLVVGCPRDNCKYLKGNLRAEKRVRTVQKILRDIGMEEDRVAMDFVSSVDGHRFSDAVSRMHGRLEAHEGGLP